MEVADLFKTEVFRFIFHIEARKIGDIGAPKAYTTYRDTETFEEARNLLYNEYEAVHIASVTKKNIK
jgi:hypothetical protein